MLLGVPMMGLRTGWGKVREEDVLVAEALMVDGCKAVCDNTWNREKHWLCCINQQAASAGSVERGLLAR